ncbi:MAG: SulP family inorganic anion transporter [Cyclobacteriaceae bacterium]
MNIPADGLAGLKQNWKADMLSGFLVFLLALPLSLGIAKASEFPPAMGVLTAMIGGLLVTFFAGSKLTIKGPAAGLITIAAGAVTEMGGGAEGWKLALGAIVVASLLQILFGILKFGSLSDFFPHSAVHGMLAAIGLIIFSKQIHVLLGIDPATLKGLEPLELFKMIPDSIRHEDPRVTMLGLISLVIIFGLPFVKSRLIKKIPAPMYVLAVTIPLAWMMDFKHTEPAFDMVKIGDFWAGIGLNADFSGFGTFVFWKYVLMFLFVSSLESLLTVKAIDSLDPWHRPSQPNKDLIAIGIGNTVSGLFGGLPMISEVARSSANVNFGGRTRWANFFHGTFLLIAMLLFIPVIEMIPNTALAALLIAVGYRLASPNEFFKVYKIGSEQLVIFVFTIIVTLATDLLLGVGAGILTKFFFHIINGVPFRSLFKSHFNVTAEGDHVTVRIFQAAIFSNILSFKRLFESIKTYRRITLDFHEAIMLDHSFMELMHHFQDSIEQNGGHFTITGFERFKPSSNHPLASRKFEPDYANRFDFRLNDRQVGLRDFATTGGFLFNPQRFRNILKFRGFPFNSGRKILFEENLMISHLEWGRVEVSDVGLQEGQETVVMTVIEVTETDVTMPDFSLEPESLWSKFSELTFGNDIDFKINPAFSKKYYLRGSDEVAVRSFFKPALLDFFENRGSMHLEVIKGRILLFLDFRQLSVAEINSLILFINEFIQVAGSGLISRSHE